ncbi:hypothetical protein CASFOL_041852 [Castilleja foliolosa]|uniref:Uncharacterized protein n=1 Tax=Castilleja foliolosa TaxID=1961234 RepID=A0ABD3B8W2_9LAMI
MFYIHHVNVKLFFIVICKLLFTVNCISTTNEITNLPIDTTFKLPSPLPTFPKGAGFATGEIDLGGLKIRQISSFKKICSTNEGGPNNLGATFFEPSSIPNGFSMLGAYAQPNNQPLFGWVLVGKTNAKDNSGNILKPPIDYTLQANINNAYFWVPTPPDGYKPIGLVVTTSPDKPSLDKIQCVRSDFTDELETDNWIWGENGLNVYGLRPKTRGTNAQPVSVGTFNVQTSAKPTLPLSYLKNKNTIFTSTPNRNQIETLFQTYSPFIYFHPEENYLPSSVNWFFANGALLYTKGKESSPVSIQPNGSNLPQGGSNDGLYWLDLPVDKRARENVVKGDLQSAEVYLHVKPVLGSTFTDIQMWVFYPFNGHAAAKLGFLKKVSLGHIGEHVGDWEHVTMRISNFDGTIYRVFFAQHDGGKWVDSSLLEYQNGNKFAVYASLNGHASYNRAGLVLLGGDDDFGVRDDTSRSGAVMDTGGVFKVVAADGLGKGESVVAPPWLEYAREWGPNVTYDFGKEVKKIEKLLFGSVKKKFTNLMNSLPSEIYGKEGPTGPKMKDNWNGDEHEN